MGRLGRVVRALCETSPDVPDRDLPVFGLTRPVADRRGQMNTGVWPLSKRAATATGHGVASLARRLTPEPPGEVVEVDVLPDGWTPADDEEVA